MDEKTNTNSVAYWNERFGTGDWAKKGGHSQTKMFAEAQVPLLNLPSDFDGSILDFGCGAGDALPVYRQRFRRAKLMGMDFSPEAIRLCAETYGDIGNFICGDVSAVPDSDVIICSNVLEHLAEDQAALRTLLQRSRTLFVIVPYRERDPHGEHLRPYDEHSFAELAPTRKVIFLARGWTQFGYDHYVGIYVKNIARLLLGRKLHYRNKQILFEFKLPPPRA